MLDVIAQARAARAAALKLANAPIKIRNQALHAIADRVAAEAEALQKTNAEDAADAEKRVEAGELGPELLERLILNEKKIDGIVTSLRSVAELPDPIGHTRWAREISPGLELYQVTVPIGVLGIVFESRPDVGPQVGSLCLKSGNAVLMKGGREATRTNRLLAQLMTEAAATVDGIPDGWLHLLETREEVDAILRLDEYIDLLIPRGGNAFVRHVMDNSTIPVLGHADGICHVYVDKDASIPMAVEVVVDSKTQYVAVCNAAETLLVHAEIAEPFLTAAAGRLAEKGVELRLDERASAVLADYPNAVAATEEDWSTEYLELVLSVKVVDRLAEAIDHVNAYGSHHTDAIVTQDAAAAESFLRAVDSASVMHNASTRFADGFRYGLGAEVGIGTGKIHSRGPVGLDGLTIYKYLLKGTGQTVSTHTDAGGKVAYTHRDIDKAT